MATPKVSLYDYQNQTNVRGLITTNQTSHAFRPEPCLNNHPVRTSMFDGKPLEMMMQNPLPLHDTYVTTNRVFHGRKFLEEEYRQPMHFQAPPLRRVHYIKPDFHRKMASGEYIRDPIYDSETFDKFRAKPRVHDIYGPPRVQIPYRDVHLPMGKDDGVVFRFDRDAPYSVIRMAHPYLTTNQMTHRQFTPEEYEPGRVHPSKVEMARAEIQKREVPDNKVGPMEDVLEQNIKVHPLLDVVKDYPSGFPNDAGRKRFFRYHLYKGCAPRVHLPVDHLGWNPTTAALHGNPGSVQNKNNFTSPVKACYFQPRPSANSAMAVPWMYSTESKVYGSGRSLGNYVNLGNPDICGDTSVF